MGFWLVMNYSLCEGCFDLALVSYIFLFQMQAVLRV